jgi:hypothetical protein
MKLEITKGPWGNVNATLEGEDLLAEEKGRGVCLDINEVYKRALKRLGVEITFQGRQL